MAQNKAKADRLKNNTEIINVLAGMYGAHHIWYTPYHVRIWLGKGLVDIFPVSQKVNTKVWDKIPKYHPVPCVETYLEGWLKKQKIPS